MTSPNNIMKSYNQELLNSNEIKENPLYPMLLSTFSKWQDHQVRIIVSPDYNTFFDYADGTFFRCGKTLKDDPPFAELGPEILDMEISTICHGIKGYGPCQFCYKSNTGKGKNMPFEMFRTIFNKMPPNLTQIAFGVGDLDAHPDLEDILVYCNKNPHGRTVVPNITINGDRLTEDYVILLRDMCGAVAVSHYDDDICFDAVKKLTDEGMKQINIHQMISEETFDDAMGVMQSYLDDPRLKKLNAIVFLSLKQKGRGVHFHPLEQSKFTQLIDFALEHDIPIGFDSCSAFKFFNATQNHPQAKIFQTYAEPCESTLFSAYINVDGKFFPCSFTENQTDEWMEDKGLNVVTCDDFLEDIWHHKKTQKFREQLLFTACGNSFQCRTCPIYKV